MALEHTSGKDKRYGHAEQSVFGTEVADGAAFNELDTDHFNIDKDVQTIETDDAHATRNPTYDDQTNNVNGSAPSFTVSGDAKRLELADWLYAHFQKVVEGATTPYDKTFTFPTTPAQPDFTVDAGYFATFIERFPTASYSWKVIDAISQELTLSGNPGEYVKFAQAWMARGAGSETANPSGTWTINPKDRWHWADIARVTIDGTAVTMTAGWEVKLSRTLDKVGHGSGSFDTFGLVLNKLTFKMVILKDALTQSMMTKLKAGTGITVNLGWGNVTPGTDDGDLDITFTAKLLTVKPNNEDTQGIELTGNILAATPGAEPITIIMADAVDRTW